jgi:hypothetical protein
VVRGAICADTGCDPIVGGSNALDETGNTLWRAPALRRPRAFFAGPPLR